MSSDLPPLARGAADASGGTPSPSWQPPGADGSALDVRSIMGVLRRKAWLIATVTVLALGGMYYLTTREVQQYRAEALVRLRDGGAALAGGMLANATPQGNRGGNPFLSEIFVIRGRGLAGDVVDREGLRLIDPTHWRPVPFTSDVSVALPPTESAWVTLRFRTDSVHATAEVDTAAAAYGAPLDVGGVRMTVGARPAVSETSLVVVPRDDAIDWVLGSLSAAQRSGTDVVSVTFTSTDADVAVRLVNAVVEQYQARSARIDREEARARREFIDAELRQADSAFASARGHLEAFRARAQVYRSNERATAEQTALIQREIQWEELQGEKRLLQALAAQLERADPATVRAAYRNLTVTPSVAQAPVLNQLVQQLTTYELQRDSLLIAGRPPTHESVRQLESLMAANRVRIVDALESQIEALDRRLESLSDRRARSVAELQRLSPTEAEEARLTHDVERTRNRADQLRQQKELARIAEAAALGNVEIMERATRALRPSRNTVRMLALALGAGLLFGAGIAFLIENLNTSIHRRAELEEVLQVPGLAVIPRLPIDKPGLFGGKNGRDTWSTVPHGRPGNGTRKQTAAAASTLVTINHAHDRSAEAYRVLRTRLLFLRDKLPLRTLVVTSAAVGEGKTTTVANLATALAQQGVRVLLIDCDLRRPRLHRIFGTTRAPGMTDVLKQSVPPEVAIRSTAIERLHLLPRGSATLQPAELLGGEWMIATLRMLAEGYEMVIIDTPPLLAASDAAGLAARADGVLFVLRAGDTGRAMAQEAMHQLTAVGANVIGAVLNDPDADVEKYESYGYAGAYLYGS